MGFASLPPLHAHTKYTAGMQLCVGVGFHPNSQIGAVYAHAEATHVQALHYNETGFFSKICSTCLVIFTHLDHFLRELPFFDLQSVRRLLIRQLAIHLHTKH